MPISSLLAGAAEGDFVQKRDMIPDHGCFADHETRRMIEQNAGTDFGSRVNIDCKDFADATLKVEGRFRAPLVPQKVPDSVGLQGMEPLEVEKRYRVAGTGRIPLPKSLKIGADRSTNACVRSHRIINDITEKHLRQRRCPQFVCQ